MKCAIIKADDLVIGQNTRQWKRIFDIGTEYQIPVCSGVVGRWSERNLASSPDSAKWLHPYINNNAAYLWNHGWTHRAGEFRSASLEEQTSSIKETHDFIFNTFGVKTTVFGAPFNEYSEHTIEACEISGVIDTVFTAQSHNTTITTIPKDFFISPEEVRTTFNFNINTFRRKYSRLNNIDAELLVIQIHPWRWSLNTFNRLEKALDLILADGYRFVDAGEAGRLLKGTNEEQTQDNAIKTFAQQYSLRASTICDSAGEKGKLGQSNFSPRLKDNATDYIKLIEGIGFTEKRLGTNLRAVDIGAGLGHLSVGFLLANPNSVIEVVEPSSELTNAIESIVANSFLDRRITINNIDGGSYSPKSGLDCVILSSSLMFMPHGRVLDSVSARHVNGGELYVVYHQSGHYLRRAFEGFEQSNAKQVKYWILKLINAQLLGLGIWVSKPHECIEQPIFDQLMKSYGYRKDRSPEVWDAEPSEFYGHKSYIEVVYTKSGPARLEDHSPDQLCRLAKAGRAEDVLDLLMNDDVIYDHSSYLNALISAASRTGNFFAVSPEMLQHPEVDTTTKAAYYMACGGYETASDLLDGIEIDSPEHGLMSVISALYSQDKKKAADISAKIFEKWTDSPMACSSRILVLSLADDLEALEAVFSTLKSRSALARPSIA